jgi:hypothetical protein
VARRGAGLVLLFVELRERPGGGSRSRLGIDRRRPPLPVVVRIGRNKCDAQAVRPLLLRAHHNLVSLVPLPRVLIKQHLCCAACLTSRIARSRLLFRVDAPTLFPASPGRKRGARLASWAHELWQVKRDATMSSIWCWLARIRPPPPDGSSTSQTKPPSVPASPSCWLSAAPIPPSASPTRRRLPITSAPAPSRGRTRHETRSAALEPDALGIARLAQQERPLRFVIGFSPIRSR